MELDGTVYKSVVQGVKITCNEDLPKDYIEMYIAHVRSRNHGVSPKSLEIMFDEDDYANLKYEIPSQPFEKIRRITGYLVGTVDRFNDAKRQEVEDRVKHM